MSTNTTFSVGSAPILDADAVKDALYNSTPQILAALTGSTYPTGAVTLTMEQIQQAAHDVLVIPALPASGLAIAIPESSGQNAVYQNMFQFSDAMDIIDLKFVLAGTGTGAQGVKFTCSNAASVVLQQFGVAGTSVQVMAGGPASGVPVNPIHVLVNNSAAVGATPNIVFNVCHGIADLAT